MNRFIARGALALLTLGLASGASRVDAQGLTGQIGGSAVDPSRDVLVGATVTLQHEGTSEARTTTTNAQSNRIRGLNAPDAAINNFSTNNRIPFDSYNTQSIEISRGPTSAPCTGRGSATTST